MSRYSKAVAAAVIAALIGLVQLAQSLWFDGEWTREDTFTLALAALGAVSVYLVRNVNPADKPYDPTISEAEAGHADLTTVLIALACAIVVVTVYAVLI